MKTNLYIITLIFSLASLEAVAQPWPPSAPPLPLPTTNIIHASNVEQLFSAVEKVKPNQTILLEDGTYYMPRYLEIGADNVSLRSASGDRKAVILDGSKSIHGELVGFRSCSGVTVADITIQNIKWNGFKINSDHNVQNLTIYNCVIHNIWQRGVKSVRIPKENREEIRPKNIRIQHCLFYNDHPKQFSNDETDTPKTFNGNYIGGIDAMYAKNWLISDNVFMNIQGRTREGRGCVFMWHHAEDCIIERNTIIDCDVGIALGNSSGIGPNQSSIHGTNMIVRNNFVTRTPESGILADHTKDCQIINNTIFDPDNRMNRLLRIIHDNQGLLVANNLLSGPGMSIETDQAIRLEHNLIGDFSQLFVDVQKGDLHLTKPSAKIIDQGMSLPSIKNDIDQQARDQQIDIGADQWKK